MVSKNIMKKIKRRMTTKTRKRTIISPRKKCQQGLTGEEEKKDILAFFLSFFSLALWSLPFHHSFHIHYQPPHLRNKSSTMLSLFSLPHHPPLILPRYTYVLFSLLGKGVIVSVLKPAMPLYMSLGKM